MPLPPRHFATERLSARPLRAEDAPAAFAAYGSDPRVTRYLSWKAYGEVEPMAKFFHEQADVWRTGRGQYAWLLFLRDRPAPIGSIGVGFEGGKALFGYVFASPHWGQGLATEALRWLVDWSLAQPELYRAWAYCDAENPASARVMEKAGMRREGVLRRWHACPTLGPELRDCVVCAKTR